MRILFFMGTETNFNPGKISSIETLVMVNGSLRKGMSEVFNVEHIIEYFEEKYLLTADEAQLYSAGNTFKDKYDKIVNEIIKADLIISFDYFDYYDIFFAKEFFLSSPLEKAEVMHILYDKLIDLSIYKEENESIFDFYASFDKTLDSEMDRIKNKLYMMPRDKKLDTDPNKMRVVLLLFIFCILVFNGDLMLSDELEKDVKYFIDQFFGGMIF